MTHRNTVDRKKAERTADAVRLKQIFKVNCFRFLLSKQQQKTMCWRAENKTGGV